MINKQDKLRSQIYDLIQKFSQYTSILHIGIKNDLVKCCYCNREGIDIKKYKKCPYCGVLLQRYENIEVFIDTILIKDDILICRDFNDKGYQLKLKDIMYIDICIDNFNYPRNYFE